MEPFPGRPSVELDLDFELDTDIPQDVVEDLILLYPEDDVRHGREHITAVVGNVLRLFPDYPDATPADRNNAVLAACLHDLQQRHGDFNADEVWDYIGTQVSADKVSRQVVDDAIYDHNKPKSHWIGASPVVSGMLYDADKMDTIPERFYLPIDPESDPDGVNRDKYTAYVLMVRSAMTSNTARNHITQQLPPELRGNIFDDKMDTTEVIGRYALLHSLWETSTMPARRAVAAQCLSMMGNKRFRDHVLVNMEGLPRSVSASPDHARFYWRLLRMRNDTHHALEGLEELAEIAGDEHPGQVEQLRSYLEEKMVIYEGFMRASAQYNEDHLDDMSLFAGHAPIGLRRNYGRAMNEYTSHWEHINFDRFLYFRGLFKDAMKYGIHATSKDDLPELLAARQIQDRNYYQLRERIGADSLEEAITEIRRTRSPEDASEMLQFLAKNGLRTADRYNDILGTDEYVFMLPDSQSHEATVGKLGHRYYVDLQSVAEDAHLQFAGVSHYHAIHIARMQHSPEELPAAYRDAMRLYSSSLYSRSDYIELCSMLFSAVADEGSVDRDMFNFIMQSLVVNEESPVEMLLDGGAQAPEWLEVDYFKRGDPRWNHASQIVSDLNRVCAAVGIIPPFKPYIIARGPLQYTDVQQF